MHQTHFVHMKIAKMSCQADRYLSDSGLWTARVPLNADVAVEVGSGVCVQKSVGHDEFLQCRTANPRSTSNM